MSRREYMRNPDNFKGGGEAKLLKHVAANRPKKKGGCGLVVLVALGALTAASSTVGAVTTWLA